MEEDEAKKIIIAQANVLTESRQDFTVIEKRCLYQVICEIRKRYVDKGENAEFEDLRLFLPPEVLTPLADRPREAFAALRKLRNREVIIENDDVALATSWILQAKHDKIKNIYEVLVSKDIMPYLVCLASQFTAYYLTVAIALKSSYSQRFYELCSQYKNRPNRVFYLSIEEMRDMFQLKDKYKNMTMFRHRVLETAQNEIKELFDAGQCDLWFEYTPKDKVGRSVISYYFFVHLKEDKTGEGLDYQSVDTAIKRAIQIIKPFFPRDKKFVTRVMTEIQKRPEIAENLTYKLEQKILDYDAASIPPIIRFVLKEDYGIV